MKINLKLLLTLFLTLLLQNSFAQQKTITGIVKDDKGTASGVNITIKGSPTRNTSTDFDGSYSIKASVGETLIYTYLGMGSQTRTITSNTSVYNITFQEATKELETVVVNTAFGIKKRKDALVSATQVVTGKELTQAASPNILQSLSGKVSGLQISQTSSGVEGSTRVVLRGARSITGNNQAMVVLDGTISSLDVLNQLPPDVIENVTVLKGQQGGTLYGEQGSNGVIIVTTKKGSKTSKMSVSINSAADFQSIAFVPEVQTRYGQGWYGYNFDSSQDPFDPRNASSHFSSYENGSWGESFVSGPFAGTIVPVGLPQPDGTFLTNVYSSRGKDNFKSFYKTGVILQNGIAINAGNEDGYALLSFNRQTTDFVVDKDILKRNNILFKAGKKFGNFSFDGSINYTNSITSTTDADLLEQLIQLPTNIDLNQFRNAQHYSNYTSYARNPFRLIEQIRNDNNLDLFVINLGLAYKFNKNITLNYNSNLRTSFEIGTSHDDGYKFANITYSLTAANLNLDNDNPNFSTFGDYAGGGDSTSTFEIAQSFRRVLYNDIIANFNYDLNKNFNLKFNIGAVVQDNKFKIVSQGGKNLDVPGFYQISNVLLPTLPYKLDNKTRFLRNLGAFTNADLAIKDYLFANIGLRSDVASQVPNKYAYYTGGLSFIATKAIESIKDSKIINYVKLNASIAQVGNASPVEFGATNDTARNADGFPFGSVVGFEANVTPTRPGIKPEFVTTKEFGLTLGLFRDRVTLESSFYVTNTKDLITNTVAPTSTGLRTIQSNIGDLQNKGFEIDLGLNPIRNEGTGFNWNLKINYSTFKTIITALSAGVTETPLQVSNRNGYGIYAEVGEEFPLIKGTTFQRTAAGQIIVDDSGNAIRNQNFSKLGKSTPDYILGFSNTFNYRGFQLVTVADYRTGHSFYSETYRNLLFTGGAPETAVQDRFAGYVVPNSVHLVNGVYEPNTTPAYSSLGYANGLNGQVNDYYNNVVRTTGESNIFDATAFKIREISLSYGIPSRFLNNTGISSFRCGINARNPFVIFSENGHGRKNLGYADPESANTSGNGIGVANIGQYPTLRTIGFSLNLTF